MNAPHTSQPDDGARPARTNQATAGLLLCALVLALPACAQERGRRWIQQADVVASAHDVARAALPMMSDDTVTSVDGLLGAARSALDRAWPHIPDGGRAYDGPMGEAAAMLRQVHAILATLHAEPDEPEP